MRPLDQVRSRLPGRTTASLRQPAFASQELLDDFMDSSGLRALMEMWHSQTAAGLDLLIRNPSDPVRRTLHYAGLDRVFKIDRRSQPGS